MQREIWDGFYARVHVFVSGMLGGSAVDPDDAVQEIMLKVLAHLESYKPRFALSTWVFSIARNHCRHVSRRQSSMPRPGLYVDDAGMRTSHYPSPEHCVLEAELEGAIEGFVGSLSSPDRQIAYLRFHEEMEYRDIDRAMGMPTGTAKYRVFRIRAALRAHLEEEYDCVSAIG